MFPRTVQDNWLDALNDEDLAFLKRFILASGSLKDLAAVYEVTYPTIRLRLDRLVDKIKLLESMKSVSAFEKMVMGMYADGKVDVNTMKAILVAHEREVRGAGESKLGAEQKVSG